VKRSAAIAAIAAGAVTAPALVGAQALAQVSVGITNSVADVPFILADKLGYFREAGIAATLMPFDGAPKMIAPLGIGQLDVGSGAPSAGFYNGVARGLNVRMVADKGSPRKGYGYGPLMVRKELVASGKYKTPHDLKGLKIGEIAPGGASTATLAKLLATVGLGYGDVQHVYLPFPDHVAAIANGSIDAALPNEPFATIMERQGTAVRIMGNDVWYPNQEIAVVIYGKSLLAERRELGLPFMRAWIRAVRFYNDALAGGHLRGRTAKDVIDALVASTDIKDRSIYNDMIASSVNPDGKMNAASLADDLAFFKQQGLIQVPVEVAAAIDTGFQADAVRSLGPYRERRS
jgi:NitT/TauT family transport system substrate-binding protein